MSSLIEDYGIIGDTETVALVSRDGSIDWMCVPRFDGGACFAALLGGRENGRWQLHPSERVDRIERRYVDDTLVLERTIDVHIRSLRKKLGESSKYIQTVRGIGYRFLEPETSAVH